MIKVEGIKTVILVFLIGVSMVLTFLVWNYEGTFDETSNQDAQPATLNGEEQTKDDVIYPNRLIYQIGDDNAVGFEEKSLEREIFQTIQDWSLYNFEQREQGSYDEYAYRKLKMTFPTALPSSVINDLFQLENPVIFERFFDRIVIFIDENRDQHHIVFKSSNDSGPDIVANIQNTQKAIDYLEEKRTDNANKLISYRQVEGAQEQDIYIPSNPELKGRKFRYRTVDYDSNEFLNILFYNPAIVSHANTPNGEEVYSDDHRELMIDGYYMEFSKFSLSQNNQGSNNDDTDDQGSQLITNTINHMNKHKGWFVGQGIQYQLYNLSVPGHSVDYRMVYNQHPIFSSKNLAHIYLHMDGQEVLSYHRSLVQLTYSYDRASTPLMTAQELIRSIEASETYSFDQIVDIQVGYQMSQEGEQVYDLIPTWSIRTYSGWEIVDENTFTEQGGNQ
ncbi:hypothetical protein J416_13284 [Gracilibacillus halophilus YIM-C55.5]|uniref:Regulatory protein YycH domain-containing protein n=1 Tax=Gracilibacillus halophilus YIM-C55.5 TaxID=1308866 RepID=N4W6V6_9BACI|nr:two-component system activity regulator YycH [Gracilibacillus halophilus]ENH95953.1 hypothetical protein J416_13284 [Gracilibacillus halophilus YIM-C55.5]